MAIENISKKPRIAAGLEALNSLLADGGWHSHLELIGVIQGTGLAERTALNMLADIRHQKLAEVQNRAVYPERYRYWYRKAS